jgi:CTP synthase
VRGVDGKVEAIRWARRHGVPFLGLCLGLQCAVIEYARGVLGLESAHSAEFVPDTPDPVIDLLPEQHGVTELGGTMRLGAYAALLVPGTRVHGLYGTERITERHRHRYEVNSVYRDRLEAAGMVVSGTSPDGGLVEFIELADHPFFVATQAHPELRSRPNRPHPLFSGLVGAAVRHRRESIGRLPVELDEPTAAELDAARALGGPVGVAAVGG